MSFEILPPEMRMEIYDYLTLTSLVQMSRTCAYFYNDVQPYINRLLENSKSSTQIVCNPQLDPSTPIKIRESVQPGNCINLFITIIDKRGKWKINKFLSHEKNNKEIQRVKFNMVYSERLEITGTLLRSLWPASITIFEEIIKYLPNCTELSMPGYTWSQLYRLYAKSNEYTKQWIQNLKKIDLRWLSLNSTLGNTEYDVESINFYNDILSPKIYSMLTWVPVLGYAPDFTYMSNLKKLEIKFCFKKFQNRKYIPETPYKWIGFPKRYNLPNLQELYLQGGYYRTPEVLDIISNSPKLQSLNLQMFRGFCDIQPALSSGLFPELNTLIIDFGIGRGTSEYCVEKETEVCVWPKILNSHISRCCTKKLGRKRKLND